MMTLQPNETLYQYCLYKKNADGIYILTPMGKLQHTRYEMDAMFAHLAYIYDNLSPGEYPLLLIDNSKTYVSPPVSYFARSFRSWDMEYGQRPPGALAYLMPQDNLIVKMFMGIVNRLPRREDALKVFHASDRDKALEWLLEQRH